MDIENYFKLKTAPQVPRGPFKTIEQLQLDWVNKILKRKEESQILPVIIRGESNGEKGKGVNPTPVG